MQLIEWANQFSPDRLVCVGVLGLTIRKYLGDEIPDSAQPEQTNLHKGEAIENLRVWSDKSFEEPIYHATTGIYGFINLPVGKQKIFIFDEKNRYLPYVIDIEVKSDIYHFKQKAESGVDLNNEKAPTIQKEILLRPAFQYVKISGETVIWGVIKNSANAVVPFAKIEVETRLNSNPARIETYSNFDGNYLVRFTGELPDVLTAPDPVYELNRQVRVHKPKQELLEKIKNTKTLIEREKELIKLIPVNIYDMNQAELLNYYDSINQVDIRFQPSGDAGQETNQLKISIGNSIRWDIVI